MAPIKEDRNESLEPISVEADEASQGMRVDAFLAEQLEDLSRTKIQRLIQSGAVLLNSQPCRASEKVKFGDQIEIANVVTPPLALSPVAMDLDIIFEDPFLIVINKPAGLMVHPGAGAHGPTLVEGLLYHSEALSSSGGNFRPGIVHRLDKDTSGVIVCAKDDKTHDALAAQFKNKSNYREYVGLMDGTLSDIVLTRESYLRRDLRSRVRFCSMEVAEYEVKLQETGHPPKGVKFAKSYFKTLSVFAKRLTYASIQLETGRTHQIRVHARDLEAPIVGDPVYGRTLSRLQMFATPLQEELKGLKRQMLHARILGIEHPLTKKKMAFEAPLPSDFLQLLRRLEPLAD